MSGFSDSRKRKIEEPSEQKKGRNKIAKSAPAEEPISNLKIVTLTENVWTISPSSVEQQKHEKLVPNSISKCEEENQGFVNRGTLWKNDANHSDEGASRMLLSCRRESFGDKHNCETQTYHFIRSREETEEKGYKRLCLKTTDDVGVNIGDIKVQIEDLANFPKVCCIRDCQQEHVDETGFYKVPTNVHEKTLWCDALDIDRDVVDSDLELYVCSHHFISLSQHFSPKSRSRKKKTFDRMLVEEAGKMQGNTASGRPKRTPKPNKNYDWAELLPLIKSEPIDEEEEIEPASAPKSPLRVEYGRKNQVHVYMKSEEEGSVDSKRTLINAAPEKVMIVEEEEEEEEEYGEDVSLPSGPRAPPPKRKGRPARVQDTCTQTDLQHNFKSRVPLREVKVQCSMNGNLKEPCVACSSINWLRLESLLLDCLTQIENELCDPLVAQCLRRVLANVEQPTNASNVLKILSGVERDELEAVSDIVLVPGYEDYEEVEIENVIHPDVDAPLTGLKEITPQIWNKNSSKMPKQDAEYTKTEPEEFGLQEAAELDDNDLTQGLCEDDQDDEGDVEWNIKQEGDGRSVAKKKRKTPLKARKERECHGGETEGQEEAVRATQSVDSGGGGDIVYTQYMQNSPVDSKPKLSSRVSEQKRVVKLPRKCGDTRWVRGTFACPKCKKGFTTKLKMEHHYKHIHLGVAPWKGSHQCKLCGKTFTQKIGLKVHRMHKHGDPKKFPCHLCNFKGVSKAKLARHLQTHSDKRNFFCEFCGLALKTSDTYRNHMTLHTNEGKYQCSVCQKVFNHKQYYEDHCRSHFDVRAFTCDMCPTAFKTKKSLRNHIRGVHLNDKHFVCDVCDAHFMTSFNLRSHMKKHDKVCYRIHKCDFCSFKCHNEVELNAHINFTHPDVHKTIEIKIGTDVEGNSSQISSTVYEDFKNKSADDISCQNGKYAVEIEHLIGEDDSKVVTYETRRTLIVDDNKEALRATEAILHVYPCNSCGKIFNSEQDFAIHVQNCQNQ